jgi:hypothetical protein
LNAGRLALRDTIEAHVAFGHFLDLSVILRNAKRACGNAELAANARFRFNDNGAFISFYNSVNRARIETCGVFAVHTSPVEKTPLGAIGAGIVVEVKSDMSISIV